MITRSASWIHVTRDLKFPTRIRNFELCIEPIVQTNLCLIFFSRNIIEKLLMTIRRINCIGR